VVGCHKPDNKLLYSIQVRQPRCVVQN
jgi:hypothetical protein